MKLLRENPDPETNMFAKTELVNLLVSENVEARTEARRGMGITEEDELLPFLAGCLTHHHYEELRSAAGRVLAHLGDDSVLFGRAGSGGSPRSGVSGHGAVNRR